MSTQPTNITDLFKMYEEEEDNASYNPVITDDNDDNDDNTDNTDNTEEVQAHATKETSNTEDQEPADSDNDDNDGGNSSDNTPEVANSEAVGAVQSAADTAREHLAKAPSLEDITQKYTADAPQVDLASSGMLVALNISIWSANKRDKKASAEMTASKNVKGKLARVNKTLLACPELDAIKRIGDEARQTHHYKMTMPYMRGAVDYLPTEQFQRYVEVMDDCRKRFDAAVEQFVQKYSWLKVQINADLGDLYDASDYPSEDEVRRKFAFNVDYMPVPQNSFHQQVSDEQRKALEEHFERRERERTTRMLQTRWAEFFEGVVALLGKISYDTQQEKKDLPAGSKRLYDSTVQNLKLQCDMLDSFNVANDPVLRDAVRVVREALSGVDADTLKKNDSRRRATRDKLRELAERF